MIGHFLMILGAILFLLAFCMQGVLWFHVVVKSEHGTKPFFLNRLAWGYMREENLTESGRKIKNSSLLLFKYAFMTMFVGFIFNVLWLGLRSWV